MARKDSRGNVLYGGLLRLLHNGRHKSNRGEYELRPAENGLLVSVEKEISRVREICRRALTKKRKRVYTYCR